MTASQVRDAFAALTDRELLLVFYTLPPPVQQSLGEALHAELDRIAHEEALR